MPSPSAASLVNWLRLHGPTPAGQLQAQLGISQSTLSRLVTSARADVVRIGRARRSVYAATREVRTFGRDWPVYRVAADARFEHVATLHALSRRSWWWQTPQPPGWLRDDFADGVFPDLPWFMQDVRPQGFLGRAFARRHAAALGLGADPLLWDTDGVLAALLELGNDLPGNFVLGDRAVEMLQRAMLGEPDGIADDVCVARYEALANAALAGDVAGSSAGGEQPKFTACRRDPDGSFRQVLVKFSPPIDSPAGQRWADLLRSEHLAAETLLAHGVAACRTAWVEGPQRAFLEVTRFDRRGAFGRRGAVTLLALDSAYYGALDTWPAAADRLQRDGWLGANDADVLRTLWWFGQLIANADMHFANASLLLEGQRPLLLAPAYDMLPMHYRPTSAGEIVDRPFQVALPPPRQRATWERGMAMALDYWQRVGGDSRVSEWFRAEATANAAALQHAGDRLGH